jgi:hypothetical protein
VLIPRHLLFIRRFFFFVKKNIYNYLIFESSDERFALNFLFLFFCVSIPNSTVLHHTHERGEIKKRKGGKNAAARNKMQSVLLFFPILSPLYFHLCCAAESREKISGQMRL